MKFVTGTGLKTVLDKLYKWSPLKKGTGINSAISNENNIANNENEIALGQYNESKENTIFEVGVGSSVDDRENAIEIHKDGMLYILNPEAKNSSESIQELINRKESIVVSDYDTAQEYVNENNFGKLIYIQTPTEGIAVAGLYIVSMDASNGGKAVLSRLAITTSESEDIQETVAQLSTKVTNVETKVTELEPRVISLESFKETGALSETEINKILK